MINANPRHAKATDFHGNPANGFKQISSGLAVGHHFIGFRQYGIDLVKSGHPALFAGSRLQHHCQILFVPFRDFCQAHHQRHGSGYPHLEGTGHHGRRSGQKIGLGRFQSPDTLGKQLLPGETCGLENLLVDIVGRRLIHIHHLTGIEINENDPFISKIKELCEEIGTYDH